MAAVQDEALALCEGCWRDVFGADWVPERPANEERVWLSCVGCLRLTRAGIYVLAGDLDEALGYL